MQIKKILVPLDGSKAAETALPAVEILAKTLNATVCIMRAYYARVFPGVDPGEAQLVAMREAEDYVQKIEKRLTAAGLSVDTHTRYEAEAAKAILDHCEENNIDLIIMATHGHGVIGHWLLGNVAEKVVHHTTTPIYLAPVTK
jgi:nucleotide-binding universal stress UspA family protein